MKQTVTQAEVFKRQLKVYKELIDDDIERYAKHVQKITLQQYGAAARLEVDAFLSILDRGGKRIRGALTILGYEMSGGTNQAMIVQAARAVEMLHAYILIVDDFQDRSAVRRGGPTAHKMLATYHRKHELRGDADHFGAALAFNAALGGNHAAQVVLSNLDADPQLRANAMSIMNRTMLVTGHGQTNDIMNSVLAEVDEASVERVLEWKTANYTILNPLHMGMVLAGADCHATDAITEYAMHTGKAFQLSDDLIGTFGTEAEIGKSPRDDMREGKRTSLILYTLKHVDDGNKNFLIQMLGNEHISQAEFERCKDIIIESGAVQFAKEEAAKHIKLAVASLDTEAARWTPEGVNFLRELAQYLLVRTT